MEILIKLYSGVLHNRIRSWDTNFYPTEEVYSVPLTFLFKSEYKIYYASFLLASEIHLYIGSSANQIIAFSA